MSLVVTTYVPEGIVLASDSRQFLTIGRKDNEGKELPKLEVVNSDAVYKTFALAKQKVGINTFGQDLLSGIPMGSYIRQFEETLNEKEETESIAPKLLNFFRSISQEANTGFYLAGYKKEQITGLSGTSKKEIYVPYVFFVHIKDNKIERINFNNVQKRNIFGASWGGEADIISGLLKINDSNSPQIIWEAMSLQDAIDFSIFSIRTTIDTMRFQARQKTVGGSIDVLVVTPENLSWIQKKELRGE